MDPEENNPKGLLDEGSKDDFSDHLVPTGTSQDQAAREFIPKNQRKAQANTTEESRDDPTPSSFWPNYTSGNNHGVNLNEKPSL